MSILVSICSALTEFGLARMGLLLDEGDKGSSYLF